MKKSRLKFNLVFTIFIVFLIYIASFSVLKATSVPGPGDKPEIEVDPMEPFANDGILPNGAAKITSSELVVLRTGEGPFDADDTPGNDSSADNYVVRSFDKVTWTVENTMEIKDGEEKYIGGTIYFEATVPDGFDSSTFAWDLKSMNWIENPKVSADGMTLTGQYSMKKTDITVPGKQNLIFAGNVYGAKNGTELQPVFKTWLNGNTEEEICVSTFDPITVSAKGQYNVKLIRNQYCQTRTTVNIDGEEITGRMYAYEIIPQLYGDNVSKGLKGIEYPEGPFNVDITLALLEKTATGKNYEDASDKFSPILYQYYLAGNGGPGIPGYIEGREIYRGMSNPVWNGNCNLLFGVYNKNNRLACVYDSGTPTIIQEGNVLHFSVENYKFDGTFPTSYNQTQNNVFGPNIGCFAGVMVQILVPDFDDFDKTSKYEFDVLTDNMSCTSPSSGIITTQQDTKDDKQAVTYEKNRGGTYSDIFRLFRTNSSGIQNGVDIAGMSSWGSGDARVYKGQRFAIASNLQQGDSNDEDMYPRTINNYVKFDGIAFNPIVFPDKFLNTAKDLTFRMWYTTKQDGTNWSSDKEQDDAQVKDAVLYENIEDVPEGHIITGVYYESTSGTMIEGGFNLEFPVIVTDKAEINHTYQVTQEVVYYNYPLDRTIYTQTNPDVEWPTNYVYKPNKNYIKSVIDEYGQVATGTHNGTDKGQSITVTCAQQGVSIAAIGDDGKAKTKYDLAKNEYDVTYKIQPTILNNVTSVQGPDGINTKVMAHLPEGMSYVANSCEYGEPEIIYNADGTSTLTWIVRDCEVNVGINPIIFKAHLSEESANGQSFTVTGEVLADDKVIGTTRPELRTATTSISIIDLAAHRLYKRIVTPVIEKNGTIMYKISYKNNTDVEVPDLKILDILPFNGDERGTDYTGTYKVSDIVVKQVGKNGQTILNNDNLQVYYTTEDLGDITSKDVNFSGWSTLNGQTLNKAITAIGIEGVAFGQELMDIDIYVETYGNKAEDKYINSSNCIVSVGTEPILTADVKAQVVTRSIEGIVWYDTNNNGIKDADEALASGVSLKLLTDNYENVYYSDGTLVLDAVTDENGYYLFRDLPADNYKVIVTMPDDSYEITLKNVGSNERVNSKFNNDTYETDTITKLNSTVLPNIAVENVNAGLVKKPTNVIVSYKEIGTEKELAKSEEITGRVEDDYSTVNKLDEIKASYGDVYEFVSVEGQTEGKMAVDTIYVTYWYEKTATSVVTKYIDIDTGLEIYDRDIEVGVIGDDYTTVNELDNINVNWNNKYVFVESTDNTEGQMTKDIIEVIYYYQKKPTKVVVSYVDTDSNAKLWPDATIDGRIDDPYTTVNELDNINVRYKNIYRFDKVTDNSKGNMTEDTIYVTYYYRKRAANLVVKYVDIDTNKEIYPQASTIGRVDDDYTTINELDNINLEYENKYVFVESTPNTEGKLVLGTTEVTYYYQKKPATMIVKYIDKDTGEEIYDQASKTGLVDDNYTTVNRLDEINEKFDGIYEFVEATPNTSGKLTVEPIEVIYYYTKKIGEIEVNYVELGTDKVLSEQIKTQEKVTTPYTTENKLDEINDKFGGIYEFVKVEGNVTGEYALEKQVITYYYQKKEAKVITKYVDVDSNEEIYDEATITGRVDDEYTTINELDNINAKHDGKYEFVRVTDNASGNMTLDTITVTYYYQKKEAEIEVNYLEVGTEKVLAEQVTKKDKVDSTYTTENKLDTINEEYNGIYEFVKVEGNPNGIYTLDKQIINYYYQKKEANVIVKYVDVDSNEEIYDEATITGRVDDEYTTVNELDNINAKHDGKYVFVRSTDNTSGNMTLDTIEVIYYYSKKDTSVITHYVDVDTNEKLYDDATQTGKVDDKYTTVNELDNINQKYNNIYEFVRDTQNTSGNMTIEQIEVTYYYTKKIGEIEVNYVELGTDKVLSEQIKTQGKVTTPYTTENKLDEINDKFSGIYEFVKVEGNVTGEYALEKQVITYYYQKKEAKVITNYVDKDTNENIYAENVQNGRIDDPYTTVNELDNINKENGNKYEFVEATNNTEGNMTLETINVVYYYQKKPTSVIVKYIDKNTNQEIYDMATINGRVDEDYTTVNELDNINKENLDKYVFVEATDNTSGKMTVDQIEVIYYYSKKDTSVITHYVDVDTNEKLYDDATQTGKVDDKYTTVNELDNINQKYNNIYEFVRVTDNATGNMTVETIEVTYYYTKKIGEIEVNYVELGTNEVLADKVTSQDKVGNSYETTNKLDEINNNFNGIYEFVKVEGNTTGEYSLEKQVITYYYQKKGAKVITKYVDIDTNEELYDSNVQNGRVDQDYTTVNELDNINKKYNDTYEYVKVTDNSSGKMTLDTIEVIYYYTLKTGEIEVNYVEYGTNVVLANQVTSSDKVGKPYTTVDKIDEIGNSYELVSVDGKTEGEYQVGKQVITYYYAKKGAKVITNYVDIDTNEKLHTEDVQIGKVDQEYTTQNKLDEINSEYDGVYEFVKATDNATGVMTEETITVTYYYVKRVGTVEVLYKEIGTEKELTSNVELSGKIGTEYTTENKLDEINSNNNGVYEFVKVDGNTSGEFEADKQIITYWYQKVPTKVIIHYKEVETEKTLAEQEIIEGRVDDTYTSKDKLDKINLEFNPYIYEFVKVDGQITGSMTKDVIEVTYWYKKKTKVVVIVTTDEVGNVLGEEEVEVVIGDNVEIEPEEKEGFDIETEIVIDPETGEETIIITYIPKEEPKPEEKPEEKPVDTSDINVIALLGVLGISIVGVKKVKFSKIK